ncbi:unnamed protein product [Candidula unifasciata]|uniref:Uncharacterized protein n=1 Tax=Candidula unifasciata TaxID=100452 RepID=A0A8S3ZMD7_9EUPU|nr:unnamed protein product [Candidula unifasciata]
MANQGQQTERDMLSCGICAGLLKEPKTLACMHRFCERCLKDHIITVTAKGTGSRPGFSCPECREFIPAPGNSSIPSTWASLLKTDFVIQSLVEVHQLQQEVSVPTVSHPCPKHRDKEQELYCFDCLVTVCHLCAVISHRACRKIGTVAEAAQQRRATWQENARQISGLIFEARNIEKTRDRNMKAVANKKSCVEVEIRQAAERMRQAVTGEEKKLIHEVQTNYDALQQHDLKFWEYIINLETLEANVVTKLASSSDFDLIADSGVSDTLDTCRIESVVTNGDYQRYYENLQVVQYSFQPHSTPSLSPGKVQFLWHAPGYDGSDFPAPSCWQPSTSVEWQPSTSAASTVNPGYLLRRLPRTVNPRHLRRRLHTTVNIGHL